MAGRGEGELRRMPRTLCRNKHATRVRGLPLTPVRPFRTSSSAHTAMVLCGSLSAGEYMRRREFITLMMGGAATVWPLAARAQQRERMRRIGVLESFNESDPQQRLLTAAFVGSLQKLGWTAGANVMIDYRWGGGNSDRIRLYAAELTRGCRRASAASIPCAASRSRLRPAIGRRSSVRTVPARPRCSTSSPGSIRRRPDRLFGRDVTTWPNHLSRAFDGA